MVIFHGSHVPLGVTNVTLLMDHQITGIYKCLPTFFPILVDVIANMVEDPCDVVDVVLQLTLVSEFSSATCTWDFRLRVVRLLMNLQRAGLFTFIPTLFSVVVDVITYMIENACDEVLVFLQSTLALESSDTTRTWDFHLRIVRLLMSLQRAGLFTFIPTLFSVVVDVIAYISKNPCDEVLVFF